MARIVNKSSGASQAVANSTDLNIPLHDTDDLVLMFVILDSGTITATPTDWIQEAYDSNGDDIYCFSHIGKATPDTTVNIASSSATTRLTYHFAVIKGAPTSSYVDVVATRGNGGKVAPFNSPSVTTSTANCLIIACTGNTGGSNPYLPDIKDNVLNFATIGSYQIGSVASYRYQLTAGATGEVLFYSEVYGNLSAITIAIKDDGNAEIPGYKDLANPPAILVNSFNSSNMKGIDGTNRQLNIAVDGDNSIPDVVGDATVGEADVSGDYSYSSNYNGFEPGFVSTVLSSSNISSAQFHQPHLGAFSLDVLDLTDEILSINIQLDFGDTGLTYTKADAMLIASDGINSMLWSMAGFDSIPDPTKAKFPFLIQMPNSSDGTTGYEIQEYNTFDRSNITRFGLGVREPGSYNGITLTPLYRLRTLTVLGGYTGGELNFLDILRLGKDNLLYTVQAQNTQSTGQFYITQKVKIGNGGTNSVIWDSTGQAVEFPGAYDGVSGRIQSQIRPATLGVEYDFGTGNSGIISSNTYNMGDFHNFTLTSGDITSDGVLVLGGTVNIFPLDNPAYGFTFSACKELVLNTGWDLSGGNIISNNVDAQAITVTSETELFNLENCTFSNNGVAIKITGDQTGTWGSSSALSGITFTGNVTKIEYTGDTDFTIKASSTTNLVSADILNSGLGTITITAPAKGIAITGLVAGSAVLIVPSGQYGATAWGNKRFYTNSSGTTETYLATIEEDVDISILNSGYDPIYLTGYTVGGTQSTLPTQQKSDRAYTVDFGDLIFGTNYNFVGTAIDVSTKTTVQQTYSYTKVIWQLESVQQSVLANIPFPFQANGTASFTMKQNSVFAWTMTSGSFTYLHRDGLRYLDEDTNTETDTWVAIWSSGETDGLTAEFQQVDGVTPINALNTGDIDQLIKIYEDGVFDYRDYLVIKYQVNGYLQGIVDVVETFGGGNLADELYVIAIEPTIIPGFTLGDPALTGVTLTNHGASPVTWNTKTFSITITDSVGGNSGENIMRWINYNIAQDAIFEGEEPFNYPDMVLESGDKFTTERGDVINSAGALLKGIRVVKNDGTTPHADFVSFQADDGTYYTPAVQITISNSNLIDGTRYQFYNVTQASELDNDVVSGGGGASLSVLFGTGEVVEDGDIIRLRATYQSGTTAKEELLAQAVATSGGVSFIDTQDDDEVYILYGLDGSTVTKFSADFVDDEIDLIIGTNFSAKEAYAWWVYNGTTIQGIQEFFGGVTAIDAANLRIEDSIVNVFWDNTTSNNVYQTDNIRMFRSDEVYPVKNPTTGGGGIDLVWRNQIFIAETGVSGLTPSESTQLSEISTVNTKVDKTLTTSKFIALK